jgi:arylsulfatase A-like enzyme
VKVPGLLRTYLFFLLALGGLPAYAEATRPNVLLILLDDVGYNDIGAFGGNTAVHTPNLDGIAEEGYMFTRHYAEVVCAPARAALLTGQFAARLGYRSLPTGISPDVPTLPKMLQSAGYHNHFVGKWLAWEGPNNSPVYQGFDSFFGFISPFYLRGNRAYRFTQGNVSYIDPWIETENDWKQYRGHLTDLLAENVVGKIHEFSTDERPWFLSYWPFAVHNPIEPGAEFAKHYPANPKGKYRALVHQLDHNIGKVLDALERSGQAENTLVVILSDNGGTNLQAENNLPFFGQKAQLLEGSSRTPLIMRWPAAWLDKAIVKDVVAIQDIFPTIAASAGLQAPANMDGRDITPVLRGEPLPPRALFWENYAGGQYTFGVLSSDGRWRLASQTAGLFSHNTSFSSSSPALQLYDLETNPEGSIDVSSRQAEKVSELLGVYKNWHISARHIKVQQTTESDGRILLTGDDYQRVPLRGRFTLAMALSAPSRKPVPAGVIARQGNVWKLSTNGSARWRLDFADKSMHIEQAPATECLAIVFSIQHPAMQAGIRRSNPKLSLSINGVTGRSQHSTDLGQTVPPFGPTEILPDSTVREAVTLKEVALYNAIIGERNPITLSMLQQKLCPEASGQPAGGVDQ